MGPPLDAVRLGPADDATEVTATQVREVAARIIAAGHWRDGDPDILVVFDAAYDLTKLAWLLAGLPGRDHGPAAQRPGHVLPRRHRGRLVRHEAAFRLTGKQPWPGPAVTAVTADAVDRTWRAFLRRFGIERMFRLFKQVLGWTRPKLRDPAAADRWTWLIIAAYTIAAAIALRVNCASADWAHSAKPATPQVVAAHILSYNRRKSDAIRETW